MAEYACIICAKKRPGRFTRERSGLKGGVGLRAGHHAPHWYCYTCLPAGKGSDEDSMTKTTTPAAAPPSALVLDAQALAKVKSQGQQLVAPLQQAVESLTVESEEDYIAADNLLTRVRTNRSTWGVIYQQIYTRVLQPLRQALDNGYAINREIDQPLEKMEKLIKSSMKSFRDADDRRREQAERDRLAEAKRLEDEARAAEEAALRARTPQMRGRLEKKAEKLAEQQMDVITTVEPVLTVAGSTTRKIPVAKVLDYPSFFMGLAEETIGVDVKLSNDIAAFLERSRRAGADVANWPGCTVQMENQIVGR